MGTKLKFTDWLADGTWGGMLNFSERICPFLDRSGLPNGSKISLSIPESTHDVGHNQKGILDVWYYLSEVTNACNHCHSFFKPVEYTPRHISVA